MGSGGEIENTVYVAVGKNVKEGKSLLEWAVKRFEGRRVCLLHVHQPAHLVSFMHRKLSESKFKRHAIKAFQELERRKMQKLLNEYLLFLSQMGVEADNVWIEMSNIGKGILELTVQHGIKWLIMGSMAEAKSTKQWLFFYHHCDALLDTYCNPKFGHSYLEGIKLEILID